MTKLGQQAFSIPLVFRSDLCIEIREFSGQDISRVLPDCTFLFFGADG